MSVFGTGGTRPASPVARARALRRRSTQAEAKLWAILRDRRLANWKFRRQVPIGRFIVDFACFEAKLIVELDGSQHYQSDADVVRDRELRQRGFEVMRFWNNDLSGHERGVLETVWSALNRLTGQEEGVATSAPSSGLRPPSPTRGEGPTAAAGAGEGPRGATAAFSLDGRRWRQPDEGGATR